MWDAYSKPAAESDEEHLWEKHLSRRTFLKTGLYGLMGAVFWRDLLGGSAEAASLSGLPRAKHCILLFMNGGPSQTDSFDPKPNHPNGGPVRAIRTSAAEIQLAHYLPQLAEQAHHLTLIRSMSTGEGNHSRARYLMHTGYPPTNTLTHPTFPAILSAEVGKPDFDLPNAVTINSPAFSAGFLGAEHDPFYVADPLKGVENVNYPPGMYRGRFRARRQMLSFLNHHFAERTTPAVLEREAIYEKADRMIHSPLTKAFDLSEEPMALRQAYGMNRFGQGCLMARRLVEAGVRCVEVSLDGWDTHQDNFSQVESLWNVVDPAMATLIRDLEERDLLHETLVVWMGEFGRTPQINQNDGRDHWPNGWTIALAGGGLVGGRVIGATDESGERVVAHPVSVEDFYFSLCRLFGIDPTKVNYSPIGRPIQIVNGGQEIPGLLPPTG